MGADFSVVMTTIDSDDGARKIVAAALAAKLAACVQVFPIRSHYVWKGELREEAEFLVQLKARTADYQALAAVIRRVHSYEVPEILRLDIADGDKAYLDWIAQATERPAVEGS
ncbi:MAG: divalent-cation tolerance protein CutA [Methylocystis sp.]|nr:divalent-cation tolerance protein CutA [Methylocystis sp.]MBI3274657.1 divalent-cation tolerance protein CutA [Methylocystis sp.]